MDLHMDNLGALPCNLLSLSHAFKVPARVTETCSLGCNLTDQPKIGRDYQGIVG